jgi:hypothetical protein
MDIIAIGITGAIDGTTGITNTDETTVLTGIGSAITRGMIGTTSTEGITMKTIRRTAINSPD